MNIAELYKIYANHPNVFTDSRNIDKNGLFFALKGDNFDGNKFAAKAIEAGAAYAIIDNKSIADDNNKYILVDDVLSTLQDLARHHRQQLGIPILAITGTNGKTTTKELVAKVLARKYNIQFTQGNFNNHIGVPLTLLSMTKDTEFGIVEMGANHIGEIAVLCNIALPDYGIINNIGKAHLEGFGSVEGVKKAKGEMYDYLEKTGGLAFINSDDDTLNQMAAQRHNLTVQKYSASLYNVKVLPTNRQNPFLRFTFSNKTVNTNLLGEYNLNNVLAAIGVGLYKEITTDTIIDAIQSYHPQNNRSQLILRGSNAVYMDAYNANPSSMEVALVNFSKIEDTNKIAILGDMLELGNDSQTEHKKIIALLEKLNLKAILVGSEFANAKETFADNFILFPDSDKVCDYLKENPVTDATILVKGSRGIRLEKVLDIL